MKPDRKMTAAAVVYTLWVVFYIVNFYLEVLVLPKNLEAWIFMGGALFCMLIPAARISELKYSPPIIIIFFIICSRFTAFTAGVIAMITMGKPLFMLPFGGVDFFVFSLLIIGLMQYMTKIGEPRNPGFSPVSLIPLLLLALPVFADLLPSGFVPVTVYSFVYTALAVWCMTAGILFGIRFPQHVVFACSAVTAAVVDMIVYAARFELPFLLPDNPAVLLFPYALFMLAHASSTIVKEDVND